MALNKSNPLNAFYRVFICYSFQFLKFWIKCQKSKSMTVLILKLEKPTILFFNRGKIYTEYVILRLNERHVWKPLNINDNSEIVQIASKGHT